MRRILPLALALLLLAACGTPAAQPTAEASPIQDGTSSLDYLPFAGAQPDYIPPMDFTPVSVWQAEPFGNNGHALLYMGKEENGVTPCKVFSFYNYAMQSLDISTSNYANDFELALYSSGEFEAGSQHKNPLTDTRSLKGTATQSEGSLLLTYTNAEKLFDTYDIAYIFDDGIPRAENYNALSNSYMLIQYLPVKFKRLPDEKLGQAMYWLPAFDVEIDRKTDTVRCIGEGNNLMELLARVPNRYMADPRSINAPAGWEEQVYGGADSLFRMWIEYGDDQQLSVKVMARAGAVTFTLDESLNITDVNFY